MEKQIKTRSSGSKVTGTVFPFTDNSSEPLFDIVASLHTVPVNSNDPVGDVWSDTSPLFQTVAFSYDGTLFVPYTPLLPGDFLNTNNPGYPINWAFLGKPPASPPSSLYVIENFPPFDKPLATSPGTKVGIYSFEDVPAGDYVLKLYRKGFVPRFALINIPTGGGDVRIRHREIVGGDANCNGEVEDSDKSLLKYYMNNNLYTPECDFNADGVVDNIAGTGRSDYAILLFNDAFIPEVYTDTTEWVNGIYSD